MEIQVPDLDDVEFEQLCGCQYASFLDTFPANPDGSVPDPLRKKPNPKCPSCLGTGWEATDIGRRLETFLARRGWTR
jgi:hypothetical protein